MDLIPAAIAYGLGLDQADVISYGLKPYDTTADLGFITTLAMAYVPSSQVNSLQLDLHSKSAAIYNNPNATLATLMSFVNPAIAILPGQSNDAYSGTDANGNSYGTTNTQQSNAGPIGGDSAQSSSVKGSSVGIGMGAVAGAAIYAAAMVYIARRYRRNRQLKRHGRMSSVPTAEYQPQMSQRSSGGMGGYFMSGGRGNRESDGRGSRNSAGSNNRSVREAGISAPVMAGNSLGWT